MAKSAKDLALKTTEERSREEIQIKEEEIKDKRIAVRLSSSLYDDFSTIVTNQDKKMSTVLTRMIKEYVEANKEYLETK